ncbi:hypothetical protein ES703_97544 [subsurface metagenome]
MSKLVVGVCIALLAAFLGEGWYLGQIQSELMETKAELATVENNIAALQDELTVRDSELVSIKQELEQTQEKLEKAQPRHFNSLEELEEWLAEDDTDQMQYSSDEFNCIDFALMLQEHALTNGYILSTEVLPVAAHWVNIAVIDDRIYIIDPQDDRIILEKRINRRS